MSILGIMELIRGMDATVGLLTVFTRSRVPLRIAALLTLYQLWHTCMLILDMLTFFLGDLGGEPFTVYGAAPLAVILAVLTTDFLVSKFKATEDARVETSAEKEERVRFEAKRAEERRTGKCSFWFVRAEYVKSWRPKSGNMSLPRFQELQSEGCLVQRTISLDDACNSKLLQEHLAVSHRWLGDTADSPPDESGQQLAEIQAYLKLPENIGVKYVWYDYWSMPQGRDRTSAQTAEFKWMLENVNVVYLGCSVLILLDLSYLSRFWTQFEAWLAMQMACKEGLRPAPDDKRRFQIRTILNGNSILGESLRSVWENKTPDEAHDVLAQQDVTVTNQSDKLKQLPKLRQLNDMVVDVMAGKSRSLLA